MTQQNITVYISDNCEQSNKLLAFLNSLGVQYTKRNITRNKSGLRELQTNNIYSTPVTKVNDIWILGFQVNKLKDNIAIEHR